MDKKLIFFIGVLTIIHSNAWKFQSGILNPVEPVKKRIIPKPREITVGIEDYHGTKQGSSYYYGSNCQQLYDRYHQQLLMFIKMGSKIVSYWLPQCEIRTGYYKSKQCRVIRGVIECWCVDPLGTIIKRNGMIHQWTGRGGWNYLEPSPNDYVREEQARNLDCEEMMSEKKRLYEMQFTTTTTTTRKPWQPYTLPTWPQVYPRNPRSYTFWYEKTPVRSYWTTTQPSNYWGDIQYDQRPKQYGTGRAGQTYPLRDSRMLRPPKPYGYYECHSARQRHMKRIMAGQEGKTKMFAEWIPECTSAGQWLPVQCARRIRAPFKYGTLYCFCVDREGYQHKNSGVWDKTPDCNGYVY